MSTRLPILPAKLSKAQVQAVYKSVAPLYNFWGEISEGKARQRCLEAARIQGGERVLEVAVGTGLMFTKLLQLNRSGWNEGVDLTAEMLERARQSAASTGMTNYQLCQGDAYHLEYEEGSFDLLLNNYMFDLLPEPDFLTVLAEFKRVLNPGGRLVLANMTKAEHWYQGYWEAVYRLNPALAGGCRGVLLLDYLNAAGFQDTHREYLSQMGFPTEIVTGIKP